MSKETKIKSVTNTFLKQLHNDALTLSDVLLHILHAPSRYDHYKSYDIQQPIVVDNLIVEMWGASGGFVGDATMRMAQHIMLTLYKAEAEELTSDKQWHFNANSAQAFQLSEFSMISMWQKMNATAPLVARFLDVVMGGKVPHWDDLNATVPDADVSIPNNIDDDNGDDGLESELGDDVKKAPRNAAERRAAIALLVSIFTYSHVPGCSRKSLYSAKQVLSV